MPARTGAGDFAQPCEQPDGHEHARANASCARRVVVRISRGPLDPHFAALEVLVLPDRRDLLDPFDRVARRGKGVGAMR